MQSLVIAIIFLLISGSSVNAASIDQANWFSPWSTCYVIDGSSNYDADAFGFSPTQTSSLQSVDIYVKKSNSPTGNSWLEVWSDSGNLPSSQIGTTSATFANSSITTSWAAHNYVFPGLPTLTAGTHYWIVFKSNIPQTGSNGSCMGGKDGLQTGLNWNINNSNILHGSVWATAASNTQKSYQIYMDLAPTPTPTQTPTPTPTLTPSPTPAGFIQGTIDISSSSGSNAFAYFRVIFAFFIINCFCFGVLIYKAFNK